MYPSIDNMLKVSTDGRKAALDLTLVGEEQPYDETSKIVQCVKKVFELYNQFEGTTQLIFCDNSTPKQGKFNVYNTIKQRLIEKGVVEQPLTNIREVEGFKGGIDYKKISSGLPYMFTDKLEYVELLVDESSIDHVVDWFGKEVKIESVGDKYKVSLLASPAAMEYWALQYVKSVQVLTPKVLRDQIKETLKKGASLYEEE